jgi:hypothetical protein
MKIGPWTFLTNGHVLNSSGHLLTTNSYEGMLVSCLIQCLVMIIAIGLFFIIIKYFARR